VLKAAAAALYRYAFYFEGGGVVLQVDTYYLACGCSQPGGGGEGVIECIRRSGCSPLNTYMSMVGVTQLEEACVALTAAVLYRKVCGVELWMGSRPPPPHTHTNTRTRLHLHNNSWCIPVL
jgi:hypothetical protein